jgi:ATP-dependent helicase/nuclease subunit A
VDQLGQVRDATLTRLRRQVLAPLLDRVARFTLAGADERRATGRLEFHDLLVRAVRLIEADAGVRRTLTDRWRVVLVDEFQDTDPLQLRLATLLALADPEVVPASWDTSVCAPGRLFFVGDPKQSIYRFRRADIALYDRAKDTFPSGQVQLTRNFRTVPEVIAWINEAFAT